MKDRMALIIDELESPLDNWTIIIDSENKPTGALTLGLVALSEIGIGKCFVEGLDDNGNDKLTEHIKNMGSDFGQYLAEILLINQQCIPKLWRKFTLFFPGTVWQDSDGHCSVLCLGWDKKKKRWVIGFIWLGYIWGFNVRLLRLYK